MKIKDKKDLIFILILIFIHLIYFSISFYYDNYHPFSGTNFKMSDSYQYLIEAENIISQGIFYSGDLNLPINPQNYTLRPPGYPLFLSLFNYFDAPFYVILFFQNIISIISIYLIRKTILLYNYDKKYDYLFIFLLFITPSQFIYANAILTEVLFQFFIVLMFVNAAKYLKFKNPRAVFWYSCALIGAAYVKPVMYLFVIPSTIYMLYLAFKHKKYHPAAFSILPILAVLLIFKWNYNRTQRIQYSSIETINLLDYNVKFFLLSKIGEEKTDKIIDSIHKESNLLENYNENFTFLDTSAKNIIKENLFSYTIYHLQGSLYALLDPGRFDLSYFFMFKTPNAKNKGILFHINNGGIKGVLAFLTNSYSPILLLFLGVIILFNIIKLLGYLLFIFSPSINLNIRIISGCFFFYIVLLVGPVGASRYLMPLVPIIIGSILLNNSMLKTVSNTLKKSFSK